MDEDVKDPVEDMLNLLSSSKNRILTQKWGLWLTRRDPERGIRVNTKSYCQRLCINPLHYSFSCHEKRGSDHTGQKMI